jgi:hypothetical protein
MTARGAAIAIGVISDTHGLLRPEAVSALRGSDLIIHAGDIGTAEVIDRLRDIARTVAVRGNNDTGRWAAHIPETETIDAGGARFHVLHEIARLGVDPVDAGLAGVVSGHSHRPSVEWRDGVLYLNPGSAGPRRFKLPVSIARMRVRGRGVRAEIVELAVRCNG